jgi:hypothetical protein
VPPGYGVNTIGKFDLTMTALDADGDGFWDVALGDPENDKAWVFMGSASGISTTPLTTLDNGADLGRFGESLSGADTDGDGFEDLAIGASFAPVDGINAGPGRVYLFRGSNAGAMTSPSLTVTGGGANYGAFGQWLALSASGS